MATKRKFKIGDRVTVTGKNNKTYGMTGTIVDYVNEEPLIQFENWNEGHAGGIIGRKHKEGACWYVPEDSICLATESIVIYRKGNVVTALDKSTGKKTEARCNPTDKFDFYVGAKLAFERLTESKAEKMVEDDKIKVGNMVRVINTGQTYPTYTMWTGLKKVKSHYVGGAIPNKHKKYIVRNIAPHDTSSDTLALIQDLDTTQVFIISIDGIKKAN